MSDKNLDLNEVVSVGGNPEDGPVLITKGTVLCSRITHQIRELLKVAAPDKYAEYKALKYPAGKSVPIPADEDAANKIAATRFLFDTARDLLTPHYVPSQQ